MRLYKYRSLEHIEYTLDILLNERLHCAPYEELNDPFEGIFHYVRKPGITHPLFGAGICAKTPRSISELPISGGKRVCSLSASSTDVRLWSHYANGHTGIAIEIDFDDIHEELHEVEYIKQLKEVSGAILLGGPESTEILRLKSHHWRYEKEYRIISSEEYYPVNEKITGVYFGLRTPQLMQEMFLNSLKKTIPVYTTKLNGKTIEIELNNQVNKDASH
jgi:hypothetical protein